MLHSQASYKTDKQRNYFYNEFNSDWELSMAYKQEIDYSVMVSFVLKVGGLNKPLVKEFPNPASDVITISSRMPIEKIELFDVLAKKYW
ncbi:hypothetical protein ACFFU9_02610 [Mariniflexile ostreae]|uniref:Uncharacterized protein n=1 Tax=Mariniflexile ostreae TaxID=1520892 RepID=A0ABV5F848_9FLAO